MREQRTGPRLVYGMRDDRSVHISELAATEGGARCDCICPACREPLIAKRGQVVTHHFAHANGAECATAGETGLHLRAKELIVQSRQVILPHLAITVTALAKYGEQGIELSASAKGETILVRGPLRIGLEAADPELWESDGFRPDVTGTLRGRRLFIEVRVTHRVDDDKRAKVAQAGTSCLELDLSDIDVMCTPSQIEEVLQESARWIWVHHAREEETRAELSRRVELEAKEKAKRAWAQDGERLLAEAKQRHQSRQRNIAARRLENQRRRQERLVPPLSPAPLTDSGFSELEEHDAPPWVGTWPDDDDGLTSEV